MTGPSEKHKSQENFLASLSTSLCPPGACMNSLRCEAHTMTDCQRKYLAQSHTFHDVECYREQQNLRTDIAERKSVPSKTRNLRTRRFHDIGLTSRSQRLAKALCGLDIYCTHRRQTLQIPALNRWSTRKDWGSATATASRTPAIPEEERRWTQ
jgi:hypothetical protein